jgi:serpin B
MSTTPIRIAALSAALVGIAAGGGVAAGIAPAPRNGEASAVVNGLGGRLQVELADGEHADGEHAEGGNLVFSPASIGIGLSMTSAGAAGATLDEFRAALGMGDPATHEAMGALSKTLTETGKGSFTLANSLWVQDGFAIAEPFETTLTEVYAAPPRQVDFEGDPAAATAEVNAWVGEETDQRITDLLAEGDVTDLTRLVLANAVLLDAEWESPFDPEATAPDEFTRGDGTAVDAEMMHQRLDARYGEDGGTQTIVLPYTNGFELIVVMPPAGQLADFETELAAAGSLDAVLDVLTETDVELSLPKWDFGVRSDLVEPMRALGLTLAFDEDRADFSNISTEIPLWVSAVVHESDITVDEAGTEAAAATAVVIGEAMALPPGSEPEPVVMDVDRPFFFAIRDFASTAVLFQGRVDDPTAS